MSPQKNDGRPNQFEAGEVEILPGYGKVKEKQLAGNLPVSEKNDAFIYFWFIESQSEPEKDPIVIWLNGGPGSSSFIGLFAENGPYKIQEDNIYVDNIVLIDNPFSWHRNASYMMIDQPPGTGLSHITDPKKSVKTEHEATEQLYNGIQAFFDRWPAYRKQDLYIFGESFAGVYIPLLATKILDKNQENNPYINLKGIGIGDGFVAPCIQESTYGNYAYAHGLICLNEKKKVDKLYNGCKEAIETSQPITSRDADKICNKIEQYISKVSGGANMYDVRVIGEYNFDIIGKYVDQPDVRKSLYVSPHVKAWKDTSKRIAYLLELGEQNSYAYLYPRLFESIRVIVYNGIYDMDCNFMGTDAWIQSLEWSFKKQFLQKERIPWFEDGKPVGHFRSFSNLTQVVVAGAGHLVPMDQPKNALALLNKFIQQKQFI